MFVSYEAKYTNHEGESLHGLFIAPYNSQMFAKLIINNNKLKFILIPA